MLLNQTNCRLTQHLPSLSFLRRVLVLLGRIGADGGLVGLKGGTVKRPVDISSQYSIPHCGGWV